MWKNYLLVAFRNLRRNRSYAVINIVGLAVGLASFLLVTLYVQHELSYDEYHEKKDRIYRVIEYRGSSKKSTTVTSVTSGGLAPELRESFAGVQDAVRIRAEGPAIIQYDNNVYRDLESYYAEPNLFNIFSFDLLKGDPETALSEPNAAVLTQSMAEKVFGEEEPVGQLFVVPDAHYGDQTYQVTGVVADPPPHSHLTFDVLFSLETLVDTRLSIGASQFWTYLLLPAGDNAPTELEEALLTYNRETLGKEFVEDVRLQPLTDIYFSDIYAPNQGDIRYVYILSVIAVVILLIACANYVNLAMARSAGRTQEIGVRKVVGAHRSQLASQFLAESLLFALIALPVALGLARLAIPLFNNLADTHLALILQENVAFVLAMLGVVGLAGLLAGSYPALVLSRFQPMDVLRDRLQANLSSAGLRQGLIVFQFGASVALIACTAVILQQLDYVQEKNLGFNEEQVVSLPMGGEVLQQHKQAIRQTLLQHPGVLEFSASSATPGDIEYQTSLIPDPAHPEKRVTASHINADTDYLETLDMKLAAGRFFSEGRASDSTEAVILNETAAREMGWSSPEEAVGQPIRLRRGQGTIIGVVNDFHVESLREEVKPVMLRMKRWGLPFPPYDEAIIRISGEDVPATMDFLKAQWDQFVPERPFTYMFLDERFDAMYRSERQTATVFGIFAGLAVFLACLGLFGLAAYAAERRTKEIGIRKVFGASIGNIVALLSKDFLWLVLASFVVAAPIAYYAMSQWLEDFAYRIELGPWLFVGAGVLALVIAMATVSYQAIYAALTNPADTLRYE